MMNINIKELIQSLKRLTVVANILKVPVETRLLKLCAPTCEQWKHLKKSIDCYNFKIKM